MWMLHLTVFTCGSKLGKLICTHLDMLTKKLWSCSPVAMTLPPGRCVGMDCRALSSQVRNNWKITQQQHPPWNLPEEHRNAELVNIFFKDLPPACLSYALAYSCSVGSSLNQTAGLIV